MSFHNRCGLCATLIRCGRSYQLYKSEYLFQAIDDLHQLLHSSPIPNDTIICAACQRKLERIFTSKNQHVLMSQLFRSTESMDIEDKPILVSQATETINIVTSDVAVQCSLFTTDTISLPIRITTTSHKYCVVCSCRFGPKSSTLISETVRLKLLMHHIIYLPPDVRCCDIHLNNNNMKIEALNLIKQNYPLITSVMINDLPRLISQVTSYLKKSTCNTLTDKQPSISFDNPLTYTDHDYNVLIGINKSDFDILCKQIEMRNTNNRSISMAVGCLLTKLRLGLSNEVLCTLFSVKDKRTIGHIIESARKAFVKHFVPFYVGFNHISREVIIKHHTRPLAKHLLTGGQDAAILVLDSTYIYVQKSTNNLLQRKLFSLHKGRPLIKPMMIVATDGYIVSAIGPYYADWRNNDANITNHLLRTNQEDILNWLRAGDTFEVDRGFRDILDFVRSLGFNIYMPSFLSKSEKKYTTSEANDNRCITKIRWIIEAINGRIKQYRYFNKVIPNSALPYIHDYLKIICSLINRFRSLYINDFSQDDMIAKIMLERKHKKNIFAQRLTNKNFLKTKNWQKMEAESSAINFPLLSPEDVQTITMGIFHIKQARSYVNEHIDEEGHYEVLVSSKDNGLLLACIQSKHTSRKQYYGIIKYDSTSILEWCCQCPNGNNTIGCCSHICSIIWYLGVARHDKTKPQQFSNYYSNYLQDASAISSSEDETSDDEHILYTLAD